MPALNVTASNETASNQTASNQTASSTAAASRAAASRAVRAGAVHTLPDRGSAGQPVPMARRDAERLLNHARAVLAEAACAGSVGTRFSQAHLAALRAAAALFAVRARPGAVPRRQRPISAWVLMQTVAPELSDWAAYFAAGAPARAAVEAGALRAVSAREADDEVRAAGQFLDIVAALVALNTDDRAPEGRAPDSATGPERAMGRLAG